MSRSCQSADVLERRQRVAAQQPRQAADPLAADRVALVRHGGRALLPRAERLLRLAHLGALQVADLGRDPLERAPQHGERREQGGVPVAAHDLGRDRLGHEPQARAAPPPRWPASRWASVPTAPESLPTAQLARARRSSRAAVAPQLLAPDQALEAEGDRLGVHAVRPPDHHRAPVRPGQVPRRAPQRAAASRPSTAPASPQLQRERRVDQVRRRSSRRAGAARRRRPSPPPRAGRRSRRGRTSASMASIRAASRRRRRAHPRGRARRDRPRAPRAPRVAASSTSSQRSRRRSSLQARTISGRQ